MTALYFHIPYCIKKCRYCDFCSVPLNDSIKQYSDLVIKEIALRKEQYPAESAKTVFFGGGTPTVLPADDLKRILEAADRAFPFSENAEISIECNPGTASAEHLHALHDAGFNRLSIGLQSTDNTLLKRIGRIHSAEDFFHTFSWAREAGFSNLNVDVMHGLPGQTQDQYLATLNTVCDLEPEHVSAYALILEQGTPLYRDVKHKTEQMPDEDTVADMQDAGMDLLERRGFSRYEISNFAKEGFRCKHNLTYWNNAPYLGFGVAAHSSMPEGRNWYRFANTESIPEYGKRLMKNKSPESERILINTFEQMFETVMLGLRKTDGVDCVAFEKRFGCGLKETYSEAVQRNRDRGLWDEEDDRYLRLNRRGLDLLNMVLLDFQTPDYWELLRS